MARKKRGKFDDDGKVPLSALIDIVFLLIFFFVFTITVKNDQIDKNVKLAKSYYMELAGAERNTFTINVQSSKEPNGLPSYTIGGRRLPLTVKQGGAGSIEGKLRIAKERHGDTVIVIIRGSKDLEFRWVQQINEVVGRADLFKVRHHTIASE
jgi:biopolymer transport protein ExbD